VSPTAFQLGKNRSSRLLLVDLYILSLTPINLIVRLENLHLIFHRSHEGLRGHECDSALWARILYNDGGGRKQCACHCMICLSPAYVRVAMCTPNTN
jgi:hypothetical protein